MAEWVRIGDINRIGNRALALCRCSGCGKEKLVDFLVRTQKCISPNGCIACVNTEKNKYADRSTWRAGGRRKHGAYNRGKVHPLYATWRAMLNRCLDSQHEDWPLYGGRGITVCDRWQDDFNAFAEDMGGVKPTARHSIDRFPNQNGNYEPGNVRWATPTEQARNKRNNRLITVNGETRCQQEWAKSIGVTSAVVQKRREMGWSDEKSVTVPACEGGYYRWIEANGERMRVSGWARRLGISPSSLWERLELGWSEHDAVTVPKGGKRPA